MGKLGVGVGEEFPAEEARREDEVVRPRPADHIDRVEETVVHHHYYRRPWRGRFLRIVLWIALLSSLFRAMDYMTNPPGGWQYRGRWSGAADYWLRSGDPSPYFPAAGAVLAVLVIGVALWFLRPRGGRGYDA